MSRILSAIVLVLWVAAPAMAHGTSVKLGYSRVTPEVLTVEVGQAVHFQNANASGAPCTVVAEGGAFESPTLGRAEGWHYTFEQVGEFAYAVQESPRARGRIIVVPAR